MMASELEGDRVRDGKNCSPLSGSDGGEGWDGPKVSGCPRQCQDIDQDSVHVVTSGGHPLGLWAGDSVEGRSVSDKAKDWGGTCEEHSGNRSASPHCAVGRPVSLSCPGRGASWSPSHADNTLWRSRHAKRKWWASSCLQHWACLALCVLCPKLF